MKTLMTLIFVLLALVAALAIVFVLLGPARVWSFFGNPDLGAVPFEQLQRRTTPNDALACPPEFCAAPADIVSPRYGVSAAELRLSFARVIASEARIENVAVNEVTLEDRYIQRSKLLGFPDTINVKFVGLPNGQSSLVIYSRSQLGKADLGVNKDRIERLLAKLAEQVPPIT